MLTIYEMSEKYNVSIRKLRRMQKDGCLRSDSSGDPLADEMRSQLQTGRPLSVRHLVALHDKPALVGEIGPYQDSAKAQINALGRIVPAPEDIWPDLSAAASHDPEAIARLIAWAKETIPDRPVHHHYLAIRLVLATPEPLRKHEYPRLNRVFLNMRKSPGFAGWFTIEQKGKRRVTWYHKPEGFDL